MTTEELELEMDKCFEYLKANEIEICIYQKDREIFRTYKEGATLRAESYYGKTSEHLHYATKYFHLVYLWEKTLGKEGN